MKQEILKSEFVHLNLEFTTQEELLGTMSSHLIDAGYVKDTFKEAIIARENVYPTGLITKSVPVAIPHTDRVHVNKSVISIATLKKPVLFKAMGMIDQPVEVEMVFMLAIDNNDGQVDMLQKLMSIITKEEVLTELRMSKNVDDTISILQNELTQ